MPEKVGVELGRSVGPFVLGQPLLTTVDVIRRHLPKHKAEVRYHESEPSRHLVVVRACGRDGASGFYVLRFDATLQLLVAISYFTPHRVRLVSTASAGDAGKSGLPCTIGDLIGTFKQPERWELALASKEGDEVRCFYEGTCFVFRCKSSGSTRDLKLEGLVASKSELLALHVTTHAGVPTHSLWGGQVSLSKLAPTRFGLFEIRLVVEAGTRSARGVEIHVRGTGAENEARKVIFGATPQDVLLTLGCPDNVWYKEDHHVHLCGYPPQRANPAAGGVYFSYRRLGLSFLIDTKPQQVKKIVLHTNVPGYFEFCSYSRCHFKASLTSGGLAAGEDDSFLLMPETKWGTVVRNVDADRIRHLGRCLYEPSTNSCYPFPPTTLWGLFDQLVVETTSHDDIAKVTIAAPDNAMTGGVASWGGAATRGDTTLLLPVREESAPVADTCGHRSSHGHKQSAVRLLDCAVKGSPPVSKDEGGMTGSTDGGCSAVEGHPPTAVGNNDDDSDLFCSAESSLEARGSSPTAATPSPSPPPGQGPPTSVSYFCPCLNAVLTRVQEVGARPAPGGATLYHDCVVYEFLSGPRVGGACSTSRAPPTLTMTLTNTDALRRVGKEREVDATETLRSKQSAELEEQGKSDLPSSSREHPPSSPPEPPPSSPPEHPPSSPPEHPPSSPPEHPPSPSPEHSLFEIILHRELVTAAPNCETGADPALDGPENNVPSEGGHTPSEGGHTPGNHMHDEGPQSPPPLPRGEEPPQILYQPPISTATPSRLLSLSQDLGMVAWARERGSWAGSTEIPTSSPSHVGTQSKKVWRRLLGHTQSSERRVRQKHRPGGSSGRRQGGEEEEEEGEVAQDARNPDGGREGCEGEPEYSQGSRLEEEGVTCEGTHETPEIAKQDVNVRDITGRDGARPPGESGDWGTPATVGGLEVASGDHGTQMRTHPLASCSQPEMVIGCEELLGNPPNQEGVGGFPDPFASIPLPSCDPQLSDGLFQLSEQPGKSPPGTSRRCWDSSEPLRPDYGPSSLDLSTVVLENISCEHDEMCEVLTKRHQVLVDLKEKMGTHPPLVPSDVLDLPSCGEFDRSLLLPTILEALNLSIANTWDIHTSTSLLPLAVELISEQADLRCVSIGCDSVLHVIDHHFSDLQLSTSESPSNPLNECLHHLKRTHFAVEKLLPRLQEHEGVGLPEHGGTTVPHVDGTLRKLLLVRERLGRVLRKPQTE